MEKKAKSGRRGEVRCDDVTRRGPQLSTSTFSHTVVCNLTKRMHDSSLKQPPNITESLHSITELQMPCHASKPLACCCVCLYDRRVLLCVFSVGGDCARWLTGCTAATTPFLNGSCSLQTATLQHLGRLVGEMENVSKTEHLRTHMWFHCGSGACACRTCVRDTVRNPLRVAVCACVAQVSCCVLQCRRDCARSLTCWLHCNWHTHPQGFALKNPTSSNACANEDPEPRSPLHAVGRNKKESQRAEAEAKLFKK